MTLIRQEGDPALCTPHIFYNHSGAKRWGGRLASELTGLEVIEILQYCRSEGDRQGNLDAHYGREGAMQAGPFHPKLLGGFPAQEWECSYLSGVMDYRDQLLESEDEDPGDEPDLDVC